MAESKIVKACLILIGNELLSGRTQDKNLAFIAKGLNEEGIQLGAAYVIPDIPDIIIDLINKTRAEFDYVFTTGGIGPTHDDITSECVAAAFGVGMFQDAETAALMKARVEERGEKMNEARLRMATFPEGAELLKNQISIAPGYKIQNVFVMAGVPRIMQTMFQEAKKYLNGGDKVLSRGMAMDLGEGTIADSLSALQQKYPDIDIGSYPQMRQDKGFTVSLVLRGRNAERLNLAHAETMQVMRNLGGNPIEEDPETSQASAEPEGK
ncbi:MAG: competence/damage-inducible protein A [Rhodospirillaceae bacterium]|nr:competence/damage-inducible protein A [Rhodospirillaceae bacterium]MBI77184.1 competence/damage-inducible protein A [Rhodospirillaceae bacterium]|tara:strand:- start:1608 stop:2408 length:801 start_codon:yes stop_codon:yes gene_type:complete